MRISSAREMLSLADVFGTYAQLLSLNDLVRELEKRGQKSLVIIRDDEALMGFEDWEFNGSRYFKWRACPPEYQNIPPPYVVVKSNAFVIVKQSRLEGTTVKGVCESGKMSEVVLLSWQDN